MYPRRVSKRALMRALLLSSSALLAVPALAGGFVNVGPAPELASTGNAYDTYSGAVSAIVTNPADANTIYIGSPNGGVWVTHDGGKSWIPLTDTQASLSIDSMSADPTDTTHQTLIAGTGLISNGAVSTSNNFYQSSGGLQDGLLYTKNGGATWSQLGATVLAGQSVDGVAARGNTIVAGTYERSSLADASLRNTGGLYRSTDGGATFTEISGGAGLPTGPVSSIVGDPNNSTKLYAAVTAPNTAGAGLNSTAIYVSTDTGATWSPIFGSANAGGVINTTDQTQIQLATGPNGAIAAGVVDVATSKLVGLYLSQNGGTTWQSLPVPVVNPGSQGNTNFTLAVDPNNTNYVYVAGDSRQNPPYTLLAFRVDAGSSTITSITDANTADNSTVHPDSRAMAFDANGQLIVSTDGGVYMRTQPQSDAGSWKTLNGNLSAIEAYQAAFGANSHLVAVAAQDNSAMLESAVGSPVYNEITGGDGTVAVVNDTTLAGDSVYYLAVQKLAGLTRVVVDSNGNTVANDQVNFNTAVNGQFNTPFVLNKIDPSLIAIGGSDVFLTQDTMAGADAPNTANLTLNLTNLGGDGGGVSAIAYGTQDNTNALIAAVGSGVWMSTSTAGGIQSLAAYAGADPTSLVFDTRTQKRFFAADTSDLWGTVDQGASFQSLTASLPSGFIRPTSLEFIANNGVDALLVGGLDNAAMLSPIVVADSDANGALSNWRFFGTGLPNVQISQLTYNPAADVLTVASFGRGAWLLYDTTSYFSQASVLQFGLANNDSTPDASLLTGNRPLIKYGSGTLLITGSGTYTGGTTINGGVLQLGNGGAGGSIQGDVVDNATFAINRSDVYTFGGAISGTGNFLQAGAGTTILTGTNTFTGSTTIAAGMLDLGNGGTSGSLTSNIVDNGLFEVNRSDTYNYAGTISGTGGFIQAGSGDTILSGTNSYTGATSVNAGTLSVNGSITSSSGVSVGSGGTLGGTGTVSGTTVANGGTLAPGNSIGTLHVTGNLSLAAGSTYMAGVSASGADEVLASGTVTVAGQLILSSQSASYVAGTTYTLINSAGALTGVFSNIVFNGNFGNVVPTTSYDANSVFVTLNANALVAWSANPGTPDWNTGSNWTGGFVPAAVDTAMFGATTQSTVNIQKANTKIAELQFAAGAPAYTFNITGTAAGASSLVIGGAGIVNQSSNVPNFVVSGISGNTGTLEFDNGATPGDSTITANAYGTAVFTGVSDASSANLVTGSGGTVDISGLAGTGMNAGSISGSGSFVLGAKTLNAGGLNTNTTVSGVISGNGGWLNKSGTGTLTLTGANTYSGGTTITAGTLQIGNGGTNGSIAGNVVDNAQFVIDRSDAVTFGGIISGTGSFTQAGTGTTILTADNTYTGATQVSAGALQVDGSIGGTSGVVVNSGGTVQGSGVIVGPLTVGNGATLAPGSGAGSVGHLAVSGNVTLGAGSNLAIDTGEASTDLLSATGTINVTGTATFNATSALHYGDTAVFATASAINGTFGSVPDTITGVLYPVVTVANTGSGQELVVTMDAASFLTQLNGASPDETTIADALDSARGSHYADLKSIYDTLDTQSGNALKTTFDNLAPYATRSLSQISMLQMGGFTNLIGNHLADLADGSSGTGTAHSQIDTGALNLAQRDMSPFTEANNMLAFAQDAGAAQAAQPQTPASPTPAQLDLGKGVSVFLLGSSLDGSVATGGAGGKARVNGYLIATGADLHIDNNFVLGAAISYADSTAKLSATPANTKSSAFQVLAYGRYTGNGWFAEGFAGSSAQHITAGRTVVIGGTTSNLQGRTSGSSPTVGVSAGMPFVESDFVITPAAGLQWEDASIDGYTETGGVAAMTYHSFSRTSFTGRLGFDAVGNYTLSNVTIRPLVRAYLVHDFISNTGAVTAAFAQAPGALMTFGLANKSTNWVELGVGAQAKVSDNASVSIRYDATAGRSDLFSGAWTGDLNVRF